MTRDTKEGLLYIIASILLIAIIIFVSYHFDKKSCLDKTTNYNANLKSYSFIPSYCFVEMENGSTVNLENYRDTNEIK